MPIAQSLAEPLRRALARRVTDLFNDRARGERPVVRVQDGLFGSDSVAWKVHGDVTSMMIGGIAGLLLQMLMPEVLAGVWDHSGFRADTHGRLRRTARFIATTTYGRREEALHAIDRVNAIHAKLSGTLPDGRPYRVNDPAALAWVHAAETVTFLGAWLRVREPRMPLAEQDRYFAEMAVIGRALGADPVASTHRDTWQVLEERRSLAVADARTREVAAFVLGRGRDAAVPRPLALVIRRSAIDLLPPWARTLHGFQAPALIRPGLDFGAKGLSHTLAWAMAR